MSDCDGLSVKTAKLADDIEQAYRDWTSSSDHEDERMGDLQDLLNHWFDARKTARKSGLREVLLSEETVVALRRGVVLSHAASAAMCADGGRAQREYDEQVKYAFDLLVRNLADLLKEKPHG
jgi:hypothetical protein